MLILAPDTIWISSKSCERKISAIHNFVFHCCSSYSNLINCKRTVVYVGRYLLNISTQNEKILLGSAQWIIFLDVVIKFSQGLWRKVLT